MKEQITLFEKN